MATASVNNIIGHINANPPVYPNLFLVLFETPVGLGLIPDNERLTFSCIRAELPGKALMSFQTPSSASAPDRTYAYRENYIQDLTMTFRLGTDFYEKTFFNDWIDSIVRPINKFNAWPDTYKTNLRIYQLDKNLQSLIEKGSYTKKGFLEQIKDGFRENILNPLLGRTPEDLSKSSDVSDWSRIIYGIKFEEVFPVDVNAVSLDSTTKDTISEVTVQFKYRQWVRVNAAGDVIAPQGSTTTETGASIAALDRVDAMRQRNGGIIEANKQNFGINSPFTGQP